MSYASQIADALRPSLSGYRVRGYTTTLDQVNEPTVLVWVEDITRPAALDRTRVQVEARVQVLVGNIKPDRIDEPLDNALDDVLDAITAAGAWLDWTRVERVVRLDAFHAYTIHCTTLATIGD